MDQPPVLAALGLPPPYRRGLESAASSAGWQFTADPDSATVVVTPLSRGETCLTVDRLVEAGRRVVALLDPFDRDEITHALRHSAAPANGGAEAEAIVAVAAAACHGAALLPLAVAARLSSAPDIHRPGPVLTDEESRWLEALARGMTVARLADGAGFSERAMFRRLADLYTRLGVTGRSEAIVAAERLGLLGGPAG